MLEAARRLGVDIDSVCGGRGICGRCQVEVSEGEHAKHAITSAASHLSPIGDVERAYAADRGLAPGRRLGCTAHVEGELVIDVPPESQVHRQVVRKEADAHPIEIDPVVRLHYVEVEEPDLASPTSDLGRLREALEREWQLTGLAVDDHVLPGLQKALRAGDWRVTVAVHDGDGDHRRLAGLPRHGATGSRSTSARRPSPGTSATCTTGEVLASAGEMNPQIRFGEDLMSRVSYVMMNPGSEKELTRVVRGCLAKLTAELANDAGVSRDDILEITLVGNPIMHHLLLGLDPTELGGAPFALAIDEAVRRPATELGLPVHPGARAYVLPCIAGHVGADTAGVILSEGPYLGDEVNLIVDVGTNAEIVLGNRERLARRVEPDGPGLRGRPDQLRPAGRARRDRARAHRPGDARAALPRDRQRPLVGRPGFAGTHVTGVCGSGIIEVVAELHLAGVLTTDGTIDGALAARSPRIVPDGRTFSYVLSDGEPELTVTQNDIRQIQLAKAALHAGCMLLLRALRDRPTSTGSASRAPSATTSIPSTRSCSGSSPTATRPTSPPPATPPAPAPGSRCSTARRAPRSRRSCVASRRSRPPSSRASRSSSSARWRFRTTPIRTSGCAPSSRCRRVASPIRRRAARRRRARSADPAERSTV